LEKRGKERRTEEKGREEKGEGGRRGRKSLKSTMTTVFERVAENPAPICSRLPRIFLNPRDPGRCSERPVGSMNMARGDNQLLLRRH